MTTKKLTRRGDKKRILRSFVRHTLIVMHAILVAATVTIGWSLLRENGYHLSYEDGETISVAIVNTLAIIFSLLAAVVLATIWENYRKIVDCVLKQNKEEFLLYRDERIPTMLFVLLVAFSVPLVAVIGMLEWHHYWSGFAGVSSVTFAVSLVFVVAAELQNPLKSPWMAERIPSDWFDEDIDKRFKTKEDDES